MKYPQKYLLILAVAFLNAGNTFATPVTWAGSGGMSVMNNPNAMSVMSSTVLPPQNTALQTQASNKAAAAAAAAQPTAAQTEAALFQQTFQQQAFSSLAQGIAGGTLTSASGNENLGPGESLMWAPDGHGGTTVSLTSPGSVTTIDVPKL